MHIRSWTFTVPSNYVNYVQQHITVRKGVTLFPENSHNDTRLVNETPFGYVFVYLTANLQDRHNFFQRRFQKFQTMF